MSSKLWSIFNVMLCVIGIIGGISGGATFSLVYNNNAASLWAGVSVLVLLICLLQELFKHNDILHVCHTHSSLVACEIVAVIMILFLTVLSAMHFIVAYMGEEAMENMEFNDYIVGIWTVYCMKCSFGLCYSSRKCRKRLSELEGLRERPESPNFLSSGPPVAYEQLNSPSRRPNRFSSGPSARTQFQSDDESVVTEGDSVSTGGQFTTARATSVVSDGESAIDMDRAAEELDAGASVFRDSRLVVT